MEDQLIVTPFFLDEPLPELRPLAGASGIVNAPALTEADIPSNLSTSHRALADLVAQSVGRGERPVSIAGDCCATIGVAAGLRRAGIEPTLVWLDAHGDFNTPETSPSGFLGGMPLAMLVGRGDDTLTRAVGLEPLAEERVVLSDARDLDPAEREALEGSRIRHLDDITALLDAALPEGPLWVHFDTDVVDPSEVPAHHYTAPGGPSSVAVRSVFEQLARSGQVAAVSMSTWDPPRDRDGASRRMSMSLLEALIT